MFSGKESHSWRVCNILWKKILLFISFLLLHSFHRVSHRYCTDRNNESSFPIHLHLFDILPQKLSHIWLSWVILSFLQNLSLHDSPACLENTHTHRGRARALLPITPLPAMSLALWIPREPPFLKNLWWEILSKTLWNRSSLLTSWITFTQVVASAFKALWYVLKVRL